MADVDPPNHPVWPRQLELFGGEPSPAYGLNPDEMRAKLHTLLAEARAAKTMPWPPLRARLYRMMFPQMTFWLPEEEGAQLRFEFETEFARLDAAAQGDTTFDIHLNADAWWANVPARVWGYTLGGYQVLDKYLKSRKGRKLQLDQINHVSAIADSLAFTIDQMAKIDAAYRAAFPDKG